MGNKSLKSNIDDLNYMNENYPKKIRYLKDLTMDAFSHPQLTLDNTFIVFKSINDIYYLIYYTENKSIISYDLITCQKINVIKNQDVYTFKHYLDKKKKRDLILSMSLDRVKIWNVNNWKCLSNIEVYKDTLNMYSYIIACLLNDNNKNYILSIRCLYKNSKIELFDFNGKKIKDIIKLKERPYFIDTYNDNKLKRAFIITSCYRYIMSYDYTNNKNYHKYYNRTESHSSIAHIIIKDNDEIVKMYENDEYCVRIWDFHKGQLLNKINVYQFYYLNSICFWNEDYLIGACGSDRFILAELNGKIPCNLEQNYRFIEIKIKHKVYNIKKIFLPKYGNCLITQGKDKEQIKLWVNC